MNTNRLFCVVVLMLLSAILGCNRQQTIAASGVREASDDVQAPRTVSRIVDCTFDNIKFDMADQATFERTLLTPKIEQLFGQRIRIRGYIFPTLKKKGLKQFILVRDNLECCFGPGAALFDCIAVEMEAGKTAEYSFRPVIVEGTFGLNVQEFNGTIVAIYRMSGENVE